MAMISSSCEKKGKKMVSAQRNGDADTTPQRKEKWTETTVQMNRDTPTTQRTGTQDKYVSVSTGVLSYSIHIQFFSQNQSLLLLSLIQIQIIITRMTQEEKRQLQYVQYKNISERQ